MGLKWLRWRQKEWKQRMDSSLRGILQCGRLDRSHKDWRWIVKVLKSQEVILEWMTSCKAPQLLMCSQEATASLWSHMRKKQECFRGRQGCMQSERGLLLLTTWPLLRVRSLRNIKSTSLRVNSCRSWWLVIIRRWVLNLESLSVANGCGRWRIGSMSGSWSYSSLNISLKTTKLLAHRSLATITRSCLSSQRKIWTRRSKKL